MAMKQGTALLLKGLLLLSLVVGLIGVASADSKYNPFTGEYELTTPDAKLEYSPFSGEWHYVPGSGRSDPVRQEPVKTDPVADIVKSAAPNNDSGGK